MLHESKRYLGLELAGAKNPKTALAVLEFYPKEKKTFLLDIHEKIALPPEPSEYDGFPHADHALLEMIRETIAEVPEKRIKMGVNVPLELPPSILCLVHARHKATARCSCPGVKWMREFTRKAQRTHGLKVLEFIPYTQRPIELWIRYQVLPNLHPWERFEIDETLGGNKAPLTARMLFLKPHLHGLSMVETWPKLSIIALAAQLGISKRIISAYRKLEEGAQAREEIIEALVKERGIFIYERDIRKLSQNLSCFDALICAYTALLSDIDLTTAPPTGFPISTGWVEYPNRW